MPFIMISIGLDMDGLHDNNYIFADKDIIIIIRICCLNTNPWKNIQDKTGKSHDQRNYATSCRYHYCHTIISLKIQKSS